MSDPIDEAGRALQTAIGSNETKLREALGNDGYELFIRRQNCVDDLRVVDAGHHAEETRLTGRVLAARARFWTSLAGAIATAATLAVGWSIWEWLR